MRDALKKMRGKKKEQMRKRTKDTCYLLLLRWRLHSCRGRLTLREREKKHKTETVTFFNSAPKACVRAKACAYVGASGNPPSVVEYVHIAVCVFALSVWAACVRLSVNLFPAQSVCQSVIFCLLDKEIERMRVCVCVCTEQIHLNRGDGRQVLLFFL